MIMHEAVAAGIKMEHHIVAFVQPMKIWMISTQLKLEKKGNAVVRNGVGGGLEVWSPEPPKDIAVS